MAPDSIANRIDSAGSDLRNSRGSSSALIVDSTKLMPYALLTGAALVASIVSGFIAIQSVKEAKQVQIQLMYANAIFLREGLVKPGDMVYGPEGNLQFRAIEIGKPKEK